MEKEIYIGDESITGNVYCVCGQWTGHNVYVNKPPHKCQFCGRLVVTYSEYKKDY